MILVNMCSSCSFSVHGSAICLFLVGIERPVMRSFEHVYDMPEWTIFGLVDEPSTHASTVGLIQGEPMTGFQAMSEVAA